MMPTTSPICSLCTVSDGWGGTNFQNVYIAIVSLPTNAVPAFTSVVNSNGTLQLDLAGMSGLTYVLQATTNLISSGGWLPLVQMSRHKRLLEFQRPHHEPSATLLPAQTRAVIRPLPARAVAIASARDRFAPAR